MRKLDSIFKETFEMENGKAEAIYLRRLFSFLGFIKEEIIYFIVQEEIHLLQKAIWRIHILTYHYVPQCYIMAI